MEFVETTQIDGIWSYMVSIDWTDPWLLVLLSCHGLFTFTTLTTRTHGNIQAGLFSMFLLLVYFSENINELGARYWIHFSRQQYFDSRGMFISLVVSFPLLLNCLIMVCNWLWISGNLLIQLKQAELKIMKSRTPKSNNLKKID